MGIQTDTDGIYVRSDIAYYAARFWHNPSYVCSLVPDEVCNSVLIHARWRLPVIHQSELVSHDVFFASDSDSVGRRTVECRVAES